MKTISLKRMAAALMAAACIGCPVWASGEDGKVSDDKADRHSVKVLPSLFEMAGKAPAYIVPYHHLLFV